MSNLKLLNGSVKGRKIVRAQSHKSIAKFLSALLIAPMTSKQISDYTGIHYETIRGLMSVLREENVVHVCEWKADTIGRYQTAIYSLGSGTDAEKPKPQNGSLRQKKSKLKQAKNDSIYQPKTVLIGGKLWA